MARDRTTVLILMLLLAGCGAAKATPTPTVAPTPCIERSIVQHQGSFAADGQQAALALQNGDAAELLRELRLMASEARSAADALRAARADLAAHLDRAADALDSAATAADSGADVNSWLTQAASETQQAFAFDRASLCL